MARNAVHGDATTHQAGQALTDRQAEPRATVAPGRRGIPLGEGFEQLRLPLERDADAGVDDVDESRLELRAVQTGVFDATEVSEMLRAVIGTLQDLGFVIEEADRRMGLVSGTTFYKNQRPRMTVTVRPQGDAQLVVRTGAHFALETVSDPEPYQEFFSSLGKSWFLESGRPRLSTSPPP